MTLKETPEARYERMSIKETELRQQGYQYIAGVDEAGRGPLAGPVLRRLSFVTGPPYHWT